MNKNYIMYVAVKSTLFKENPDKCSDTDFFRSMKNTKKNFYILNNNNTEQIG